MKTRIVWTKIWKDDWFQSLSDQGQKLFLYLITNENINISGLYQVSDFQIKSEAGIKDLEKTKTELYPKVKFVRDWVYLKNANFYGGYMGEKNEKASNIELTRVPVDVKNTLLSNNDDRVSIEYTRGIDTSINHKSEIINNKYTKIEDIKEEDLQEISSKYQVPISFVRSKLEDVDNWEQEKPGRMNGRNWKMTLINWVKRDSLKIRQGGTNGKFVIADLETS